MKNWERKSKIKEGKKEKNQRKKLQEVKHEA